MWTCGDEVGAAALTLDTLAFGMAIRVNRANELNGLRLRIELTLAQWATSHDRRYDLWGESSTDCPLSSAGVVAPYDTGISGGERPRFFPHVA